MLLIDFVHSWSESCLDKWQEQGSDFWKWLLIGSTLFEYAGTITLTTVDYVFFAGSGCGLNQFFISFNLILCVASSVLSILPAVQDANPRSGLAQSGMVAIYSTYLITSAVANHEDKSGQCNPLTSRASAARSSMIIVGAVFTFLAIAYSTSRAATQSKAFSGKKHPGAISLPQDDGELANVISTQPTKKDSLRIQAMMAAVAAGSIPASALDETSDDEDEGAPGALDRDDERTGTRYNYSWFHVIFCMGAMYVAMLLTNWCVLCDLSDGTHLLSWAQERRHGCRGGRRKGLRQDWPVFSRHVDANRLKLDLSVLPFCSWGVTDFRITGLVLYIWSLIGPVLLPDRFD